MVYYFGVYHWRKRLRAVALLASALLLAGVASLLSFPIKLLIGVSALGIGVYGAMDAKKVFRPRPWAVNQRKYDTLADQLPIDEAERVLDIGCGTGRSLVGLSPHLSDSSSITGLDRFDDRIILGNVPRLAQRNTAAAGLDITLLAGDAATLPIHDGAYDILTVCMVLHDLPEDDARCILQELRRVCSSEGTIGLLELPLINDQKLVSSQFWQDLVTDAGFTIESVRALPWKEDRDFVILTATPRDEPVVHSST